MPAPEPIGVRLARKLAQDGLCVVWTGARRPSGYGVIGGCQGGRNYYDSTHRVVYRLVKGEIPTGHQIDHLCRNRSCVTPGHLEAVTQSENIRRENQLRWHGIDHVDTADLPAEDLAQLIALLTGARP